MPLPASRTFLAVNLAPLPMSVGVASSCPFPFLRLCCLPTSYIFPLPTPLYRVFPYRPVFAVSIKGIKQSHSQTQHPLWYIAINPSLSVHPLTNCQSRDTLLFTCTAQLAKAAKQTDQAKVSCRGDPEYNTASNISPPTIATVCLTQLIIYSLVT